MLEYVFGFYSNSFPLQTTMRQTPERGFEEKALDMKTERYVEYTSFSWRRRRGKGRWRSEYRVDSERGVRTISMIEADVYKIQSMDICWLNLGLFYPYPVVSRDSLRINQIFERSVY